MKSQSNQRGTLIRPTKLLLAAAFLAGCLATQTPAQVLEHRYSFSEPNGSLTVTDSVASVNGTVNGVGNFDGSALHLDGNLGEFVDFGPNLISSFTNITIESWVSFDNTVQYTRLFDFGDTLETGQGSIGMNFSPWSVGGAARFEVFDTNQSSSFLATLPSLNNQGLVHVATVYDPQVPFMGLYVNGVLKASSTNVTIPFSALTNAHSWIGRSGYTADPYLTASVNEFRIYSGVRSSAQIAASAAGSPDQLINSLDTLQAVHLAVPSSNSLYAGIAAYAVTVTADYSNVANVNLSFTNVTLTSGNTNILVANSSAKTFDAIANGTTTLIASYGGFSATQTVVVASLPAVLTHQYHFDDTAGGGAFVDVVGSANGTVIGNASLDGTHLVLPGGSSLTAYAELPPYIISNYVALTFEFWVQFGTNNDWGRLVDFGDTNPNNNAGRNCIDFTPRRGGGAGVNFEVLDSTHSETTQPNPNLDGKNVHLVLVYNPLGKQLGIYTNGALMGQNTGITIPMSSINNAHSWLGQSSYVNDPEGVATLDEFRIYNGVLSPLRTYLNYLAGPTNYIASAGNLTNLHLSLSSLYVDQPTAITVLADYENAPNYNLAAENPAPTLKSGNTNILKFNGLTATGLAPGVTTIIASYSGFSVTQAVTVVDQPPANLTHRYSFSGPAASQPATFADSIGGADGSLVGTATVDGNGHLVLTGGTGGGNTNYAALPAHLLDTNLTFSFEAWVAFGNNPTWARFLGFGDTISGGGNSYMDFIPNDGFHGDTRWETGGFAVDQVGPTLNNKTVHLVLIYNNDPLHHYMSVYTNGVFMGANYSITPYTFNMNHCWIGKSSYGGDANGVCTVDEFRIYDGPLTARQIAVNYVAGPNVVPQPGVLSIASSVGNIVLSWPYSSDPAFVLQSSGALGTGGSWIPVGVAPSVVSGTYQVTLPVGTGPTFYRLAK